MRSSSYNIIINVDTDKYIIINGYTLAIDIINNTVYQFLKKSLTANTVEANTLETLIRRGYITYLSKEEEIKLVQHLSDKNRHQRIANQKYNFHFIISYDCNLRCVYCYERSMNDLHSLPTQKMSFAQIDQAFEIIKEKVNNDKTTRKITLYGGEPFLKENLRIIQYITERSNKLGLKLSITSNGYDLTYYRDYLIKYRDILTFQITLDGLEEIHNSYRPHYLNKDSFEVVSSNINMLLQLGIKVTLRINTDNKSLKDAYKLIEYFKDKKWLGLSNFKAYYALLRNDVKRPNKDKIITNADLLNHFFTLGKYLKNNHQISCQNFGIQEILLMLIKGKRIQYKSTFCGAQGGNIIFDPLGNIYSCWDIVGKPSYKIGIFKDNELKVDQKLIKEWTEKRVSQHQCIKCKYNLLCGGGCMISSLREKGEINMGNCNDYPNIFKCCVQNFYNEYLKNK